MLCILWCNELSLRINIHTSWYHHCYCSFFFWRVSLDLFKALNRQRNKNNKRKFQAYQNFMITNYKMCAKISRREMIRYDYGSWKPINKPLFLCCFFWNNMLMDLIIRRAVTEMFWMNTVDKIFAALSLPA